MGLQIKKKYIIKGVGKSAVLIHGYPAIEPFGSAMAASHRAKAQRIGVKAASEPLA